MSFSMDELDLERERLRYSRDCRDRMIREYEAVDPDSLADSATRDFVSLTVGQALEDLRSPGAGEFFGRIDFEAGERYYIGRRHISEKDNSPVVIDWRAAIAAPFYRATSIDPAGLLHRRRFALAQGEIESYFDEPLDDPDLAGAASGIPDPVLAEIGTARSGSMREIVSTIQAEQDDIIRSPLDGVLIVQGGPGTGKTAVALHRAAYLLFEHRQVLSTQGVLVVGPNRVFLEYVADVLPSLGERSVQQRTALDLCVPKVPITGIDDEGAARKKGSSQMAELLEKACIAHIRIPTESVRQPLGARTLVFDSDEVRAWFERALAGSGSVSKRRETLRMLAAQSLASRDVHEGGLSRAPEIARVLNRAWPSVKPETVVDRLLKEMGYGPSGKRRSWTIADQFLVDEANTILNGTPFTFGHVVVDEAQDHSAVALRVIRRRARASSLTVVGDLAQSTSPAGQSDWAEASRQLTEGASRVRHLTIGYRVPAPILDLANQLLPHTGVTSEPSTSVREVGSPAEFVLVDESMLMAVAATKLHELRDRYGNVGLIAPERIHALLDKPLAELGLRRCSNVSSLQRTDLPVLDPAGAKGLEFDAVLVLNPHEIADEGERGARLLYVAMTRAVQCLVMVGTLPFPFDISVP